MAAAWSPSFMKNLETSTDVLRNYKLFILGNIKLDVVLN